MGQLARGDFFFFSGKYENKISIFSRFYKVANYSDFSKCLFLLRGSHRVETFVD